MIGPWREKVQRPMWPSTVVMRAVLGEDSPQVSFSEDHHAVGEFGSGGEHESLGEAVRSGTARRDLHHVDTDVSQDSVESCGELAGPVANEESELSGSIAEIHEKIADLLSGPFSVGVRGHPEDVHVAAADFQHEEDIDPLERQRAVHMEEIHGQHRRGLRPQKMPPGRIGVSGWCWRYPLAFENPPDRRCADTMTELEQFALDSFVAPGRVFPGDPFDQRGDGG